MKNSSHSRRLITLLTATFLFGTLLFLRASEPSGDIRVIEVQGSPAVIVMADGNTPPIRVNDVIPPGSTVKTPADSSLKLLFANGAILILQPRSELKLTRFASKDALPMQTTTGHRPSELSKSHTDIAGEPPARYAMTRRIERARHLLARHRFTNKELAEMLGFHDGFHFAKTFKKLTGKTPRQDSLDSQGGR